MTHALRFYTTVVGDSLHSEALSSFDGKRVEVIVLVEEAPQVKTEVRPPRRFGTLAGKLHISEDFDETLPESILRSFEGEEL